MTHPPFVGRQSEVSRLVDLAHRCVADSQPKVAIVRGEMGAGKTRLVEEVCTRLDDLTPLTVVGYELERHVPLAAGQAMLRTLSNAEHEGPRLAALLAAGPQRLQHPVQVFEAARRCLAGTAPALLVIDDLQWVDELTSALAHYLLRAAQDPATALAVLVTTRPTERAEALVGSVVRLLAGPGQVLDMDLGPLDRSDGLALVTQLHPGLDRATAEVVLDRSGGNPFWLTELGQATAHPLDAEAVTVSRLTGLSADAMSVAGALAVAAAPTDLPVLTRVLCWSGTRAAAAAGELVDRAVAGRTGSMLRIVHELVREAVVAQLPAELSRRLHARLADDLERGDSRDVRVLRRALAHRRAAGERGIGVALRVSTAPDRRLLDASSLRELAAIADAEVTVDSAAAHTLLRQVAQVASEIGRPDLALEEWTSLSLRAATADERGFAALRASIAALECGDRAGARTLLEHCRVHAGLEPAVDIQRLAHESQLRATSTTASQTPMQTASAKAQALAERRGGPHRLRGEERRAWLAALEAEYYFALRTQQPVRMLDLADEIAASSDTTEDRLRGRLHRVLALRLLGRYLEAERTCRDVRLASVREQLSAVTFLSGHLLARCLHDLGRLALAGAAAADVAALADRAPVVVPSWLSAAWIRSLVHEIDVSLLGWQAARPHLQRLVEAEPDPHFRLHIEMTCAQWAARLGGTRDEPLAIASAQAAAHDARSAGCGRCAAEQAVRAAEVYARVGRPDTATRMLQRWDAEHPNPSGQDRLWRAHAEGLIVGQDDPSESAAVLNRAADDAGSMNAGLEQLWCHLDIGRILTHVDQQRSVEVLRVAAASANRLGATSEQRRALQLLRGVGVRTWRPAPVAPGAKGQLTEREQSIAQLVCQGASNPEIAEALFLSRKTIERHVSNVLAKTGVRNRAELAARLTTVRLGAP